MLLDQNTLEYSCQSVVICPAVIERPVCQAYCFFDPKMSVLFLKACIDIPLSIYLDFSVSTRLLPTLPFLKYPCAFVYYHKFYFLQNGKGQSQCSDHKHHPESFLPVCFCLICRNRHTCNIDILIILAANKLPRRLVRASFLFSLSCSRTVSNKASSIRAGTETSIQLSFSTRCTE